jgi:glycosyltransferase involved in cell wall biosynthesis
MILGKKVVVVLPALNAESTLQKTWAEMPHDIVDEVVLVDDASEDGTAALAKSLGIHHVLVHPRRGGYGANQKTCYDKALAVGADIVVMLHPDYQYTPRLITAMSSIIAQGVYPVVFGSRILGGGALRGGMPFYKYVANRLLTLTQNLLLGQKLSEYHTGYRAYAREVLESVNYPANSDDFVFDNQMIVQIFERGFAIAEVTCPTKYFPEASSINFRRSVKYGMGVLGTSFLGFFRRMGWSNSVLFERRKPA